MGCGFPSSQCKVCLRSKVLTRQQPFKVTLEHLGKRLLQFNPEISATKLHLVLCDYAKSQHVADNINRWLHLEPDVEDTNSVAGMPWSASVGELADARPHTLNGNGGMQMNGGGINANGTGGLLLSPVSAPARWASKPTSASAGALAARSESDAENLSQSQDAAATDSYAEEYEKMVTELQGDNTRLNAQLYSQVETIRRLKVQLVERPPLDHFEPIIAGLKQEVLHHDTEATAQADANRRLESKINEKNSLLADSALTTDQLRTELRQSYEDSTILRKKYDDLLHEAVNNAHTHVWKESDEALVIKQLREEIEALKAKAAESTDHGDSGFTCPVCGFGGGGEGGVSLADQVAVPQAKDMIDQPLRRTGTTKRMSLISKELLANPPNRSGTGNGNDDASVGSSSTATAGTAKSSDGKSDGNSKAKSDGHEKESNDDTKKHKKHKKGGHTPKSYPHKTTCDILCEVIEKKCKADQVDEAQDNATATMRQFVIYHFGTIYGAAGHLAAQQCRRFMLSLAKYRNLDRRLELFSVVLGISETKLWSQATGDLYSLVTRRLYDGQLDQIKERLDDGTDSTFVPTTNMVGAIIGKCKRNLHQFE